MDKTKEAVNIPGVVIDRWVIQLSKEDAAFNAWYLPPETFEPDFKGFLACLALKRIAMVAEERLTLQKQGVRATKKEQRAAAKALAVAAEKLRKATEKAEKKLKQAEEKAKVKAEAKAERERLKAEAKATKFSVGSQWDDQKEDTFIPIKVETEENQ